MNEKWSDNVIGFGRGWRSETQNRQGHGGWATLRSAKSPHTHLRQVNFIFSFPSNSTTDLLQSNIF